MTRTSWWPILAATPLLLLNPGHSPLTAQQPTEATLKAAASLYDGIIHETLPNGLRVYIKPVPESPIVTVKVAYKVGSADEDLDNTGLAHYLEHLMFKGTDKLFPGDIDRLTLRHGGANNAYTSDDYTVYFFDFAAERWQTPLQIEADRMRNLRIDEKHEFQQEKGAVISELEQGEDEPWELEHKAILPLLFGARSPYGHPTIGERAHVRAATPEIIKGFYDKWYHPNNAAIVVVGGVDAKEVLAKIKELFGPIPAGKLPERKSALPVSRKAPVRQTIESKFDLPRMVMGFNSVKIGEPDDYVLDVIDGILSSGKTSRLYRRLVEGEEIANTVSAGNYTGRYPGWFTVQVELLQGEDPKQAEELVLAELKKLAEQPVTAAELARVKRQLVASAIFGRESVNSLADSIARGVTTNDLDYLKTYLAKVSAVTAQDVQAAAKKYLDPEQRVVVWSLPKKEGGAAAPGLANPVRRLHARALNRQAASGGAAGKFSLQSAKRVVLPNGLTLLLYENKRLPIFVAEAAVRDIRLHEPANQAGVATLTGMLLDEGTAKHKGPQIAELIEDVGGELNMERDGGTVKVLSADRQLGLGLLLESLMTPSFPKEAFARKQAQLLSEIEDAETQPAPRASQAFAAIVYGQHPYGRSSLGTKESVEKLKPADCRAFHARLFTPGNTVLALVGDFDSQTVIDEVTKLTAGWKATPPAKPAIAELPRFDQFTEKIVSMPTAGQLHFYLGHAGIRRNHPDFYKLLVMDHVLGTGPGFTDRLSARLRDREGLAYTVSGAITTSAGEQPGLFTCYIGTDPEHFAKVKAIFLEELNRIRDTEPTKEEVEDVKQYLLGSLAFRLISNERIAAQLLAVERYGLGFDYLEKYRQEVSAVTPADVQAVARKHIDMKRLVLVATGGINEKGEPLKPAKK